jgi:hypothetical protein
VAGGRRQEAAEIQETGEAVRRYMWKSPIVQWPPIIQCQGKEEIYVAVSCVDPQVYVPT